jgi:hypothetical protein
MDKRLIFRYRLWGCTFGRGKHSRRSGLTVQVVNNHDAGRKPEVCGTEIQEKMCTIEIAARTTNRHR